MPPRARLPPHRIAARALGAPAGVRAQLVDFTAERKRERSPPRSGAAPPGAQATLAFGPSGVLGVRAPAQKRQQVGGEGGAAAGAWGADPGPAAAEDRERSGTVLTKGSEEDHRKLVEWLWRHGTPGM